MTDVLLLLALLALGWLVASIVAGVVFGWFVKRGRYPPPH